MTTNTKALEVLRGEWLANLRLELSGASLRELESIAIGGDILRFDDLLAVLEHAEAQDTDLARMRDALDLLETGALKEALADDEFSFHFHGYTFEDWRRGVDSYDYVPAKLLAWIVRARQALAERGRG